MNSPQLPLSLVLRDSARFESYFEGGNREALNTLRNAATGQGEGFVYLAGDAGMGKTHLLQAVCHEAAKKGLTAFYLSLAETPGLVPTVLENIEQLQLVCIDDIDLIAGNQAWERALFDFYNRIREAGYTLVVAASRRADRAGFSLPDLVSRLGWGVTYVLKPLQEADVARALVYRAGARGLELPEESVAFLLKRIPRDLPSVFDLIDRLDQASMVEQRRLTIPFVKQVLGQ